MIQNWRGEKKYFQKMKKALLRFPGEGREASQAIQQHLS
jgi:hypothetical protein